jgi:hypothetical protein
VTVSVGEAVSVGGGVLVSVNGSGVFVGGKGVGEARRGVSLGATAIWVAVGGRGVAVGSICLQPVTRSRTTNAKAIHFTEADMPSILPDY